MIEEQEIIEIKKEELVEKVTALEAKGYRLVQIHCTTLDTLIVDYTFEEYDTMKFLNYRIEIPRKDPQLPSITSIYFAAFTYENELHDLFGIKIDGNLLDFGGTFYRIEVKQPFNPEQTDQEK